MTGIIRSALITLGISSLVGIIFFFAKGSFWGPFAITAATQFIVFFIYNSIIDVWYDVQKRKAENEMYNEFTKMGIEVQCAWCQDPAYIPIDLSIKNTYTCGNCNKDNAVNITVDTAQTTRPTTSTPQDVLKDVVKPKNVKR